MFSLVTCARRRLFVLRATLRVVLLAAAALAGLPVAARTDPPPAGIPAAYDLMREAFAAHNLPLAMSYFAPDYTDTDERGRTRTRPEEERFFQARMAQVQSAQCRCVVESLTCTPAGTWADMQVRSEGIGVKRVLFARVHVRFRNTLHVRDLWVSTPQGWRIKYRQTLQDDTHLSPG